MKLWLTGLGLALLCTVKAEFECSEDHSQMLGKWYETAMASDCEHLLKHKDMIKIIVAEMTFKTDSEMHITAYFPRKNGCKKVEKKFQKLDDGTFFHKSDWGSTKLTEIVSTDCKTYGIFRAQIEHNGKTSNHLGLYTRTPELPPELKEKFLESGSSEFTKDQIMFPREVGCQNKEENEEMPVA